MAGRYSCHGSPNFTVREAKPKNLISAQEAPGLQWGNPWWGRQWEGCVERLSETEYLIFARFQAAVLVWRMVASAFDFAFYSQMGCFINLGEGRGRTYRKVKDLTCHWPLHLVLNNSSRSFSFLDKEIQLPYLILECLLANPKFLYFGQRQ